MLNRLLDHITMYRLCVYYLGGLLLISMIFSGFGWLAYNPLDILIVTAEVLGGCLLANQIMSDLLNANSNIESTIITALILALIITPKFPVSFVPIAVAGAFAIGSKYLATITEHHVFNPVAAGLLALSLLTDTSPTWWVGTPVLLPFVIIGGYLVAKKANRVKMVGHFLGIFLIVIGVASFINNGSVFAVLNTWWISITQTALLFFATIMLTEPATSPGTEKKRGYFSAITAVLYATPQLKLGVILTPEMALCLANIFSFVINPQYRFVFTLKNKREIARDTYEFEFEKPAELAYVPGQYMEWTLPHKEIDSRGNRRYFSLSSTPSENPAFAIKYYNPPSSYKKSLLSLPIGGKLSANNLAGDFVLGDRLTKPVVFIAGGIGIAPFRSMVQEIVQTKKKVDITLIYINKTADEVAYLPLWESATDYGVKTIYVMTEVKQGPVPWHGLSGHLTEEMIKNNIPEWKSSIYYVSGPQRLVEACEKILRNLSLRKKQIVTDFFPGY